MAVRVESSNNKSLPCYWFTEAPTWQKVVTVALALLTVGGIAVAVLGGLQKLPFYTLYVGNALSAASLILNLLLNYKNRPAPRVDPPVVPRVDPPVVRRRIKPILPEPAVPPSVRPDPVPQQSLPPRVDHPVVQNEVQPKPPEPQKRERAKSDPQQPSQSLPQSDADPKQKALEKLCVKHRVDPSHLPYLMKFGIFYAVDKGLNCLIEPMCALGYDKNKGIESKEKWTPLHKAASASNREAIQILLCCGADPYLKDEKGLTPFCYLKENLQNHFFTWYFKIENSLEKLLVYQGVAAGFSTPAGNLLAAAIISKDVNVVQKLLALGISPNLKSSNGRSLLTVSARASDPSIFKELLAVAESSCFQDKLLWSEVQKHGSLIWIFIRAYLATLDLSSSDIAEICDFFDRRLMCISCDSFQFEVDAKCLNSAAEKGNFKILEALLKMGGKPDATFLALTDQPNFHPWIDLICRLDEPLKKQLVNTSSFAIVDNGVRNTNIAVILQGYSEPRQAMFMHGMINQIPLFLLTLAVSIPDLSPHLEKHVATLDQNHLKWVVAFWEKTRSKEELLTKCRSNTVAALFFPHLSSKTKAYFLEEQIKQLQPKKEYQKVAMWQGLAGWWVSQEKDEEMLAKAKDLHAQLKEMSAKERGY
jgi:ankyrin repeat protein